MSAGAGARAVFINCPFDDEYKPLFEAAVFTVASCGFEPRCAMELVDSAGTRIDKIIEIIRVCPLGIHDISRTELDSANQLPRFNMPFELGIFLGAKRFGTSAQKQKACLILDRDKYRYQKFLSDIGGQDISAHGNEPKQLIVKVRDFLRTHSEGHLPSGKYIYDSYQAFEAQKRALCASVSLDEHDYRYVDFTHLVATFLASASPKLLKPAP